MPLKDVLSGPQNVSSVTRIWQLLYIMLWRVALAMISCPGSSLPSLPSQTPECFTLRLVIWERSRTWLWALDVCLFFTSTLSRTAFGSIATSFWKCLSSPPELLQDEEGNRARMTFGRFHFRSSWWAWVAHIHCFIRYLGIKCGSRALEWEGDWSIREAIMEVEKMVGSFIAQLSKSVVGECVDMGFNLASWWFKKVTKKGKSLIIDGVGEQVDFFPQETTLEDDSKTWLGSTPRLLCLTAL